MQELHMQEPHKQEAHMQEAHKQEPHMQEQEEMWGAQSPVTVEGSRRADARRESSRKSYACRIM